LYNRSEMAAVPSGLSPTPLIIIKNNNNLTIYTYCVRFEVLTAVTVKINVFWYVTPSGLVDYYRSFEEICCLHLQGPRLLLLLLSSGGDGGGGSLHNHHRKNIKSHTVTACGEAALTHRRHITIRNTFYCTRRRIKTKTKLRGFSPQVNNTDRATAACRRS
jgi:hypothetical protein